MKLRNHPARLKRDSSDNLINLISRIEVREDHVVLSLPIACLADIRPNLRSDKSADPDPADNMLCRLVLSLKIASRGRSTEVIGEAARQRRADPVLVRALRAAHKLLNADRHGQPILDASPETPHRRKLLRLASLAPDIQAAILPGTQPSAMTLVRLLECELPLKWEEQRHLFGIPQKTPTT